MTGKLKLAGAFILAALLFPLSSCGLEPPLYETGFIAMDTYVSLTVYGENAESAAKAAKEEILRIDTLMSAVNPDSEVSKINAMAGETVTVSDDTEKVIRAALKTAEKTDGALDITLRPVITEWGFTTGEYKIPDGETLNNLLKKVDYRSVRVGDNTVFLPFGEQIDLGAAAKGYAGDKAISVLKDYGVESAIVSLGGNVQALGAKTDGKKWNIAVKNPFGGGSENSVDGIGSVNSVSNICLLGIKDMAVVTSGNYERYFEGEDGKRYHHIIDPLDGYPADNGIVSATIIGKTGLECDALSTAVFVMGAEKAEKLWREKGGFEMLLVTDDKRIIITEGLSEVFTNLSGMEVTEIRK